MIGGDCGAAPSVDVGALAAVVSGAMGISSGKVGFVLCESVVQPQQQLPQSGCVALAEHRAQPVIEPLGHRLELAGALLAGRGEVDPDDSPVVDVACAEQEPIGLETV